MKSACIGAVLGLTVAGAAEAAPTVERVCEARVIAEFKPMLSHEQWLEVVEVGEDSGQITAEHAAQLRELIAEVYATHDLVAWVKRHCSSQTTLRDIGEPVKMAAGHDLAGPAATSEQD
jgi:hypothetical protein